jgi:tRNA(Ile)-lysidine synthase
MLHHVLTILKDRCFLDFHQPVVLGVSGGSDSLCLLYLLHEAGIPIVVAHYNHHLRPEADQEAEQVNRWVENLGLPFVFGERIIEGDVANHISEECARQKRYEFLFDTARDKKAQAVAVAHNADDQVETMLLHLLRGSGLTGLTGMAYYSLPNAWSQGIPLVRPLLSTWRQQIEVFIKERNLSPNVDNSNFDVTLLRNRIRRELIPYLQSYNPQIKRQLFQMAEILTDEETMIDGEVKQAWVDCFIKSEENSVELMVDEFRSQQINIQRRLVRKAISIIIPSLRDIDFGIIDRFITLSERNKNYHDADLGEGLHLSKNGNQVVITKGTLQHTGNTPQIDKGIVIPVQIPGMISLSASWCVVVERVMLGDDDRQKIEDNSDPCQIWLDIKNVESPMFFRTRKNGDIFCPLGMEGHSIKLSDFMINEKIPRSQRDNWPLLVVNGDIVWVAGRRNGHQYRVTPETREAVHLTLKQSLENGF